MGYQKGDGTAVIGNHEYGLRLTMGALAEMSSKLSISGPAELAKCLRDMCRGHGCVVLRSLMRACSSDVPTSFTDEDITRALPEICRLFEEAFRVKK